MSWVLVAETSRELGVSGGSTSPIDTTGATLIVINQAQYKGGTATLSDSKSNTWVPLTEQWPGGGNSDLLYYCVNPTVGSGHTFTISGSGIYASIGMQGWSGNNVSPFDQESGNTGNGPTLQPGSLTPSENDCLIVAGLAWGTNNDTPTIDSGFTLNLAGGVSNIGSGFAYLVQSSASAVNPTWDVISVPTQGVRVSMAVFKGAGGGGGSTWPGYQAPFGWY